MPSVHVQLIQCWFPFYCKLRVVYVSDCSLREFVCVYLQFWCRQGGIKTLTTEPRSTALSRPQHSRRLYTCHPRPPFNHQETLGKLYRLPNLHQPQWLMVSSQISAWFYKTSLLSTPKKIPQLFHQLLVIWIWRNNTLLW